MANPKAAGRTGAPDAEESARQALARARQHLQAALAEALEAVRAVLDAATLMANGKPADAHPTLAKLTKALDDLAAQLAGDASRATPPIFDAVLDALDIEIGRWEKRSESDPEARPVLRAFIGVREILWEFGLRRDTGATQSPRSQTDAPSDRPEKQRKTTQEATGRSVRRGRVQRVDVQG